MASRTWQGICGGKGVVMEMCSEPWQGFSLMVTSEGIATMHWFEPGHETPFIEREDGAICSLEQFFFAYLKGWSLKEPGALSKHYQAVIGHPDLHRAMEEFREFRQESEADYKNKQPILTPEQAQPYIQKIRAKLRGVTGK